MYSLTSDNGVHSLQSQTLIEIKIWYRSFFVILKTAIFFTRGWDEGYSDRYIHTHTHTHTHTSKWFNLKCKSTITFIHL